MVCVLQPVVIQDLHGGPVQGCIAYDQRPVTVRIPVITLFFQVRINSFRICKPLHIYKYPYFILMELITTFHNFFFVLLDFYNNYIVVPLLSE